MPVRFRDERRGYLRSRGMGQGQEARAAGGQLSGPISSVVSVFDRASATYDRTGVDFFSVFGRRLVDIAAVAPGERVLDVGCGRGAVLFPAAEAVGPAGAVRGIDPAPGMVTRTVAEVRERGLAQVRVDVGAVETLTCSVEAPYDAVLAGLVVFFLPDLDAGLRTCREVLRPGGRLAFSWFGPADPRWEPVLSVARSFLPDETSPMPMPWTGDVWREVESIEAAVAAAGFSEPSTVEEAYDVVFADPEQWYRWSWSHGSRASWEAIPADRLSDARTDCEQRLEPLREPDGSLRLRVVLRYTRAGR